MYRGQPTPLFLPRLQQTTSQCLFVNLAEGLANGALGYGLRDPFGQQFRLEPFPSHRTTREPVLNPPLGIGLIVKVAKIGQSADSPLGLNWRRALFPEKPLNLRDCAIPSGKVPYRKM